MFNLDANNLRIATPSEIVAIQVGLSDQDLTQIYLEVQHDSAYLSWFIDGYQSDVLWSGPTFNSFKSITANLTDELFADFVILNIQTVLGS